MKKLLTLLFFAIPLIGFSQPGKKVLIVATNVDSVGTNKSGTFLMEIAYPFQYFIEKGYDVHVLTPLGGKTAIYDRAKTPEDLDRIQKTSLFVDRTDGSLFPDQVNPKEYAAIYYPGGHGQFWDVTTDERIATIAATIYENGGVVGSAGHGTASLIDVRLKDGSYLVKGKTITAFPTWAELAFMNISNYGKLLPFDMQTVLLRRGANLLICTRETRENRELTHVVDTSNRMVTGSFASSAKWVAEEMVKLMESK